MQNLYDLKNSLCLYIVSDRSWLHGRTLQEVIQECIDGGATFLQLREKELDDEVFLQEAKEIKVLAQQANIPFVINDNIDIALAIDADGVHIGQHDGSIKEARKRLGKDKILGVSVQTMEQALQAEQEGADYVGVGAVFTTTTKQDADAVSYATLQAICKAIALPVVAIGGITHNNIQTLQGSGIDGVAVISAVFASEHIQQAAASMRQLSERVIAA